MTPPSLTNIRRDWGEAAPAWRKWREQFAFQSSALTALIVEVARPEPGLHILDLASGAGEPALTLAQAVGPSGRVIATDLVPPMMLGAREQAEARALGGMSFAGANAEALPFPSTCFDRVTCRLGLMFVPDTQKALSEIRRVLRSGGRAAFAAWGDSGRNTFDQTTSDVLERFLQPAPPAIPLSDRFAIPGSLPAELRQAGFDEIHEQFHEIPWPWPGTPEEYWECSCEFRTSFRRKIAQLSPEQVVQARQASLAEMAPYYDGRQIAFAGYVVIVSAVRS